VNYLSFAANGDAELLARTNLVPTKGTRQKKQPITGLNDFKAGIGDGKGTLKRLALRRAMLPAMYI
jgi:hypothetical protein